MTTPFLFRIFCLFCCFVKAFEDYFLLRYLFKYDSNCYIVNLVFVSSDLDCKTKKFKVESHFVKCKHREGTYFVCKLRSAKLSVIR